jgi:hypothetical protein
MSVSHSLFSDTEGRENVIQFLEQGRILEEVAGIDPPPEKKENYLNHKHVTKTHRKTFFIYF